VIVLLAPIKLTKLAYSVVDPDLSLICVKQKRDTIGQWVCGNVRVLCRTLPRGNFAGSGRSNITQLNFSGIERAAPYVTAPAV
jgi:hypothetical protein